MERPTRPKRPARCHAQRFSSSEPGEARAGIKTRSRRRGEQLRYEPRGAEGREMSVHSRTPELMRDLSRAVTKVDEDPVRETVFIRLFTPKDSGPGTTSSGLKRPVPVRPRR